MNNYKQVSEAFLSQYERNKSLKSKGHICFDGNYEFFVYHKRLYKSYNGNVIDLDTHVRLGSECLGKIEYFKYMIETKTIAELCRIYPVEVVAELRLLLGFNKAYNEAVSKTD